MVKMQMNNIGRVNNRDNYTTNNNPRREVLNIDINLDEFKNSRTKLSLSEGSFKVTKTNSTNNYRSKEENFNIEKVYVKHK